MLTQTRKWSMSSWEYWCPLCPGWTTELCWMCLFGGYREGDLELHGRVPPLASNSVKDGCLQYHSPSAVVVSGLQGHNFHLLEWSAQFSTHSFVFSSKHVVSNLLILSPGYSPSWETFGAFMIGAVVFFPGPMLHLAEFSICGRADLTIKIYSARNALLKYCTFLFFLFSWLKLFWNDSEENYWRGSNPKPLGVFLRQSMSSRQL